MKIEMNRCNSERNRNQKSLIAGLTLRAVVRKRRLNIFWVTQPVKSGPLPPLLHRSRSLRFPIATVRDSIPGGAASLPNCLLYFRNSAEIEHQHPIFIHTYTYACLFYFILFLYIYGCIYLKFKCVQGFDQASKDEAERDARQISKKEEEGKRGTKTETVNEIPSGLESHTPSTS